MYQTCVHLQQSGRSWPDMVGMALNCFFVVGTTPMKTDVMLDHHHHCFLFVGLFFCTYLHCESFSPPPPPPPPNDGSWNGGCDGSVGSGSSGIIDFAIAFRPVVGFSMFVFRLSLQI